MARKTVLITLIVVAASVAALVPLGLLVGAAGGTSLTVYSDDAEGADAATRLQAWSNGTGGTGGATSWQLVDASTAQQTFAGAHSPTHFWYAGLQQTPAGVTTLGYLPAADVSLLTPPIDLTNPGSYRTAKLSFWEAGQLDATVGADRFLVLVKNVTDDQSKWRTILVTPLADPTYTERGLDLTRWIGHTIQVRFRMTSAQASAGLQDGVGMNIDDISVAFNDPLSAPSAPLLLHPTSVSSTGVTLVWSPPANDGGSAILEYNVLRDGAPLGSAGTSLTYTDGSVSPGSSYTYTVTARNAQGTGPQSASTVAIAVDPTVPGAPTALVATPLVGSIALSWAAPANDGGAQITSYNVYRDGGASPYGASASRAFLDAAPGSTAHSYAVAAVNSVGEGAKSGSASGTAIAGMTFKNYVDTAAGPGRTEGVGPIGFLLATAGEPSVGVDRHTNDVLIQVDRLTLKLHPDGGSGVWSDVSYPFFASLPVSDPIGWLDPDTNRYFGGTIMGTCSQMGFTEDAGASWTPTSGACDSINAHDHETIGGGPFPPGLSSPTGYPNAVWYCAQENVYAKCALSVDGGLTYLPGEPIYNAAIAGGPTGIGSCGGIHGHIRVAPNGTAVVPNNACGTGNQQGGAIAFDGLKWHTFVVPGLTSHHFDPSASFGSDGTLYYGTCNGDGKAKVSVSRNGAATWTTPIDVGASAGIVNCEFPEMIAGDGDRAAFAFLGSTTAGDDSTSAFTGIWHMYVAYTIDHGVSWTLVDATPGDPVQAGCVDSAGTLGGACGNRNLLDFNDIALDSRGYVVIGYADGCVGACITSPSHATSTSALAAVSVQTGGPCLYAAKCALPPPSGGSTGSSGLTGTLYMTGTSPVGNVDNVASSADTLTATPPPTGPPHLVSNGAILHGANGGTLFDAHFFKSGAAALPGTVDAFFVVSTAAAATTITLRAAIYDAGPGTFATTPIARQDVVVPIGPIPTEVQITFTGLTGNLAHGFEIYLDTGSGDTGDIELLYGSSLAPSRVVFT